MGVRDVGSLALHKPSIELITELLGIMEFQEWISWVCLGCLTISLHFPQPIILQTKGLHCLGKSGNSQLFYSPRGGIPLPEGCMRIFHMSAC